MSKEIHGCSWRSTECPVMSWAVGHIGFDLRGHLRSQEEKMRTTFGRHSLLTLLIKLYKHALLAPNPKGLGAYNLGSIRTSVRPAVASRGGGAGGGGLVPRGPGQLWGHVPPFSFPNYIYILIFK